MNNTKTLNDYFEKIICINLDKRPDRWLSVLDECSKNSISVERFSAIDGKALHSSLYLKQGEIGCAMSHLAVIQRAKQEKLKNILILEDDVRFCLDINTKFFQYIEDLPRWDFLYLGANHALNNKCMSSLNGPIKISNNIYKLKEAYAMHAIAVNETVYDLILELHNNLTKPIDVLYAGLQKQTQAYVLFPNLAWQAAGFSDIQEKEINYDFLVTKEN